MYMFMFMNNETNNLKNPKKMDITMLPNEIVVLILRFTGCSITIASRVCRLWYSLTNILVKNSRLNFSAISTVSLIKWTKDNGCTWDGDSCWIAAKYGHLEVLKYLHENGCHWDSWTCRAAGIGGHLEVLKYLHENECPWDGASCWIAAKYGHLETLKWLHEERYYWNSTACKIAAESGNLEILRYLHENGCTWNKEECLRVSSNQEITNYLNQH